MLSFLQRRFTARIIFFVAFVFCFGFQEKTFAQTYYSATGLNSIEIHVVFSEESLQRSGKHFSAWGFAKQRCQDICQEPQETD
jgi:hypothetical protein